MSMHHALMSLDVHEILNQNGAVVYLYNKSGILYNIWDQIDVLSFHIKFGIIYSVKI